MEWNGLPEKDDYKGKIDMILYWAQHNGWFDTKVLKSIATQLEEPGLTDKQKTAVDNMFSKTVIKQYIFDRKY